MVQDIRTVTLSGSGADSLPFPIGAVVSEREVVVMDDRRAEVRAFRRSDGGLLRVVAQAGDDEGSVRRPTAIAAIDSGRYVIYDRGRGILSFRDSASRVIREVPLAASGFFTGLVALPAERKLVLSGRAHAKSGGDAPGYDLHEFDFSGRRVSSYAKSPRTRSGWEARFAAVFAAGVDGKLVTGSLNSNRLRFYDRTTGKTRWIDVGSGWHPPLEWPSDRELRRKDTPESVAERVTAWGHRQRLFNGVFPLDGGRLLVRVQTFTPSGERSFLYAVADTGGRTIAVSHATSALVVNTAADTVFWLERSPGGPVRFGSGRVSPDVDVARVGGAARTALAGSRE
jgi:hypothetical protein